MWIFTFLLITFFLTLVWIRQNKLLRIRFYNNLYSIGIQIKDHINTPVCDIYTEPRPFDIVLLIKHHEHLHGYRIFNKEYFKIKLEYVPVGYHLVYHINNEPAEHLYMEGTPFQLNKGTLVLSQKKRKGLSFISVEVGRSNQWPFDF